MRNQFLPGEFLELSDLTLILRPSNLKRYGLEPFSKNIKEFANNVKEEEDKNVGYKFEIVETKREHWYYCRLNKKDGRGECVKKIFHDPEKKPSWFNDHSIYGGDCRYLSTKLDDVRKHFITHHPLISSDFIFQCTNCDYKTNQALLLESI